MFNTISLKKLINRILLDIFALVHEFDRGKRKRVLIITLSWKINKRIIYVNTYTTVKGIPN